MKGHLEGAMATMRQSPDPRQAQPAPRFRRALRLIIGALIVGLLLCSCLALALVPLFAIGSRQETSTDHAFQVLFTALFALLGLLFLLTERQLRRRDRLQAPLSFTRLLFATASGLTFWTGLALFGLALARLEAPAVAGPLNIVFWAVVALWLLAEIILNARHLLRPRRARAPGRELEE
jgi:glucan phosphoethanolaminetransferase (alkaline phosphatase superfamily)